MGKDVVYISKNGYTGWLFGKSSMIIGIDKDGVLIPHFHTGSRGGDTYEWLKEKVDNYPESVKVGD